MAIKMKRPAFQKLSAVKEFTDRTEPRKAFWNRYAKMVSEGSTVISFYGAGGVGKTALLEKLEEEIKRRDELTRNVCKYVKYDFKISTDPREVLKTLKYQLSAYDCEFPLFDAGNYYYSLKVGQDINPPKAKSMLEKLQWVQNLKKNLSKVSNVTGTAMSPLNTTKMIFNAATNNSENLAGSFLKETMSFLGASMPVMSTVTTFMSIADALLMKYMEYKQVLDEDHEAVRFQLNARRQEKNPGAIYEFLPTLFAMDVADWMQETGNKLIVLFDNYELLAGAMTLTTDEQLKRDLWLRGDEGLIFMIPDTLWTIAGRNKIRWSGELADELEQHLIKALSPEDSAWFLEKAGIADENLRDGIVKLTEGYPIFLDLCVDVYTEYKNRHNAEPTIDEFGQKREEVVSRIFRYLDAAGDDAAKDMLEYLCVLNVWTDEIAVDIGGKALHNFSRNTYKRVKNFSFIESDLIEDEDISFTVYNFDRTIQSILIADCDEKLIADVRAAVNEYFKKLFADKKTFDAKEIFYLKLWANFIVRFADDAETLQAQYKDNLNTYVDALIEYANFNAAEDILKVFMNKIESFGETDTVSYSCFELDLSWLRRAQGNYNEAYDLANSAYKNCARLLGDEHSDTLSAMNNLAVILSYLGRYDEALELYQQVLTLRKKILGEEHPDTVGTMNNLAVTLGYLGRYDEASELLKQVLTLRKKILGEEHTDTLGTMNNLAALLNYLDHYDEALELQEQVLTLSKKIFGDEHTDTLYAMHNLTVTLRNFGRYDEALKLREKVVSLFKKILGDEHPDTARAIGSLANSLGDLDRYDEALELQEQVLTLRKKILGDEHPDTLMSMNNLAGALCNLGRYEKALELQEQVLTLRKKILGDEHPDTLDAIHNLAISLSDLGRHEEALTLMEIAMPLFKEIFGEDARDTLNAADTLADILSKLGRHEEAATLQSKTLAQCEKILGEEHLMTVTVMKNLAQILYDGGNHKKTLLQIERAATLAQKAFGDEHPETKKILSLREKILSGTA